MQIDGCFLPIGRELTAPFESLERSLNGQLVGVCGAFRQNILSVETTLSIPFTLVRSAVFNRRLALLRAAERIRARGKMSAGETEPSAEILKQADADAHERLIAGTAPSGDMHKKHVDQVIAELENLSAVPEMREALHELLRQGIVLMWGAFEVLARDTFLSLLNTNPSLLPGLLSDEGVKKLFQLKSVPIEKLQRYGFDLSSSLGHLLLEQHRLDDLPSIRTVYGALLPSASRLHELLGSSELWLICQRRHLVVHNRGVVDAQYLEKTGDAAAVGQRLELQPEKVEAALSLVRGIGCEVLSAANSLP
jgi:hypothetical protein